MQHAGLAPSAWVARFASLIGPNASVLDVACGSGRHVRLLAERGHAVTAIDRDAQALAPLSTLARTVVADLENAPWPLAGKTFGAVVVTNYLWRPLWPALLASLAPGGVLIYETFAAGNEAYGKPSNPQFLLQAGELLTLTQGLHVVAYEDGLLTDPMRRVQCIAALAPPRDGRSAAL
jgi:SAM-dependent methyltransferase